MRLKTFGTLSILRDGAAATDLGISRRPLAMLAMMACEGASGVTRDRLTALLWPDQEPEKARHSLGQAIYTVRRVLGAEVIVEQPAAIHLNASVLPSDVAEFEDAIARRDLAGAVAVYAGPFLDGLHVAGAAALERSIEERRLAMALAHEQALTALAAEASGAGDFPLAVSYSRRAAAANPLSGVVARALMLALFEAGDLSAALDAGRVHSMLVRDELNADADPAVREMIEAIRGGSYAAPQRPPKAAPRVTAATARSGEVTPPVTIRRAERRIGWRGAVTLGVLVAAAGGALVWDHGRAEPDPETIRFSIAIPTDEQPAATTNYSPIALSPDGRELAYVGRAAGGYQLYLRTLDRENTRVIAGTEGGEAPFFSPNGQWLGFWSSRQFRKIRLDGGPSIALADAWWANGAAWISNDLIIVGRVPTSDQLSQLSATGGGLRPFPVTRRGEYPVAVPGGRLVLFTGSGGHVGVVAPDDTGATMLAITGLPIGVIEGCLVYVGDGGALMAVPFDLGARRVAGAPVEVLNGTRVSAAALAPNGTLAYVRLSTTSRALMVDLTGAARRLTERPDDFAHPVISPSGAQVAFEMPSSKGSDIFVYDTASRTLSRLTTTGAERPSWTHDGKRIGFTGNHGKPSEIDYWDARWIRADGSGSEDTLSDSLSDGAKGIREITFSPDGRYAVLREDAKLTGRDLWLLPLTGDRGKKRVATPLERSTFSKLAARVSPDGRHLAYASDVSGRFEVYVRTFPGNGAHLQVSSSGGSEPVWAADGKSLFYRGGGKFVRATLAGSPLAVTGRRILFDDRYAANPVHQQYDVSPNGRELLVLEPEVGRGNEVFVVVGWLRELRTEMARAMAATTP